MLGPPDKMNPKVSSCSLPPAVAGPLFGELDVEVLGITLDSDTTPEKVASSLRVQWWGENPADGGTLLGLRYWVYDK